MNIAAINKEQFKEGMRLLTGAVNIVTTKGNAGQGGFTATAVCSVTDTPPTLLVCVNKNNELLHTILNNKTLAVNILPTGTEKLANRFAGFDGVEMAERLNKGNWETLETGCPILVEALSAFDCEVSETVEQGTHTIIFAKIIAIKVAEAPQSPLLYFDRDYTTVK